MQWKNNNEVTTDLHYQYATIPIVSVDISITVTLYCLNLLMDAHYLTYYKYMSQRVESKSFLFIELNHSLPFHFTCIR